MKISRDNHSFIEIGEIEYMKIINKNFNEHCTKLSFYAMSEPRGITLIVLTVTIVVLLILAGITIANITGGDGIIEQASNKKN